MTTTTFDKALKFVFGWEGGYSDHAADPGGKTNFGITQDTYSAWLKRKGRSWRWVAYITHQECLDIYREDFWFAGRCDMMKEKLAVSHFDFAVNAGPGRATEILQKTLGVKADGVIGPKTLVAIAEMPEPELLRRYINKREEYYLLDPRIGYLNRKTHIKGWINRVNALRSLLKISPQV